MIRNCMRKVTAVNIQETYWVDDELEVRAYYAGHVLGAAMFYVRVGGVYTTLYTGDYNMTPDRHLGAARVDEKLRPDLLITESTYGDMIRESKRTREAAFLHNVHRAVARGGKVLIPVFAVGRAQELCILIETYWERMQLTVPIYFSAGAYYIIYLTSKGLTERANMYYELFVGWANEKIKNTFVQRNMFDFKHIKPFDRANLDAQGPMVLFATPGMLHAGTSLDAFKKWCGNPLNMMIMPGYCVAGTVGAKVLGLRKGEHTIQVDKKTTLEVNCDVEKLSFSAHADSKGVMQLIQQIEPKNVMLVHGAKEKMNKLKADIVSTFHIPVFDPANGEVATINTRPGIETRLSSLMLKRQFFESLPDVGEPPQKKKRLFADTSINGLLVMNDAEPPHILDPEEAVYELGLQEHRLRYEAYHKVDIPDMLDAAWTALQKLFGVNSPSEYEAKHQVTSLRLAGDIEVLKHSDDTLKLIWDRSGGEMAARVLSFLEGTNVKGEDTS